MQVKITIHCIQAKTRTDLAILADFNKKTIIREELVKILFSFYSINSQLVVVTFELI